MQMTVKRFEKTLFNVAGGSAELTIVLLSYFENRGIVKGAEDKWQLHEQILDCVVDAAMNKPSKLTIGSYSITFE